MTGAAQTRSAALVVALAQATYEVDRPWGELASLAGTVSDVALNQRGHVFVLVRQDSMAEAGGDAVIELAPDGRLLSSWGKGVIADGHMIACAADGRIFVVDRDAHQIVIFSPRGEPIGALGSRARPMSPFNHPCGVAFGPTGDVFVADGYANSRMHRFSADGEFILSWGQPGAEPGQLFSPHGVWVLNDARVVVADRENNRVQVFNSDGVLLDIWTGFYRPMDVWGDRFDNIYVVDQVPSLTLLSSKGSLLGRCRPVLNSAHGIWGNARTGEIFLAEPNPSRVTRLRPT